MALTLKECRERLDALGRVSLGFYPTKLHRLERLSRELGVDLWIKREDLSGVSLFGGNKVRKLQYLMKDAIEQGCDTVFTYGATQSNHVMQTATAARLCGLRPVLYLGAIVEPKPGDARANFLLDKILGAEIHVLPSLGRSTRETMEANRPLFDEHIRRLAAEGHKVYDIPVGGSTPRGAAGFAECFVELMEQSAALALKPDYLCLATGSGGTLAGLAAGRAMTGASDVSIRGYTVGRKDPGSYPAGIARLASDVLALLGLPEKKVQPGDFTVRFDFFKPGYEHPSPAANADIRLLARTEGIFTDPVYTGKGFHGMLEDIRSGAIPKGSTVVFLHTGGATALFSEPEILGDLAD